MERGACEERGAEAETCGQCLCVPHLRCPQATLSRRLFQAEVLKSSHLACGKGGGCQSREVEWRDGGSVPPPLAERTLSFVSLLGFRFDCGGVEVRMRGENGAAARRCATRERRGISGGKGCVLCRSGARTPPTSTQRTVSNDNKSSAAAAGLCSSSICTPRAAL